MGPKLGQGGKGSVYTCQSCIGFQTLVQNYVFRTIYIFASITKIYSLVKTNSKVIIILAKNRTTGFEVAVKYLNAGSYKESVCSGQNLPEELVYYQKATGNKDYPGLFCYFQSFNIQTTLK